jgi:hypothetical protein
VALPVVISGGIEWSGASVPIIGPESAGMEVPGKVVVLSGELAGPCADAVSIDPNTNAAASVER